MKGIGMKLRRIMIAAPGSGSGKTMLTCALLQSLKNRNIQAVSYKCGPDYIDPMFHEKVIGVEAKNLDTFFTDGDKTRELFLKDRTEEEVAVLEGVMGLYDGLGGIREEGSSYHLAKITRTPILLVVDAKGMGRSLIPLISGFLSYDTEHLIQGVILNRMSQTYYETIKPVLEKELEICVLGYFEQHKELCVESRHLGLKMPFEMQDIKQKMQAAAEELEKNVSIEKILRIAEAAEELEEKKAPEKISVRPSYTIAVAKDEAFCFYYQDNLRLLEELGAKITYFSPLHDQSLPSGCSGLLLGGGYPELAAKELSENTEMLTSIREAVERGMPSVAECGGFLYLHSELRDREGNCYKMAGVIPGVCQNMGKTVRFGYLELEEKKSTFLPPGEKIRGHEFHYYDSTDNGCDCLAVKPVTGKSYPCVMEGENYWWGFPHLYYPSNPEFAKHFMERVSNYSRRHTCE